MTGGSGGCTHSPRSGDRHLIYRRVFMGDSSDEKKTGLPAAEAHNLAQLIDYARRCDAFSKGHRKVQGEVVQDAAHNTPRPADWRIERLINLVD